VFEGTVESIEIQRKEIEVGVDGQGIEVDEAWVRFRGVKFVEGGTAASRECWMGNESTEFVVGRRYIVAAFKNPDGWFEASCGWTQAIEEAKPFLAYLENYSQAGPGGYISGHVQIRRTLLEEAEPVPFARVELRGPTRRSILADEAGEFLFRELPPGDYEVEVISEPRGPNFHWR
jgi:hypothetical protein